MSWLRALALVVGVVAGFVAPRAIAEDAGLARVPARLQPRLDPPANHPGVPEKTKCSVCHVTASWHQVRAFPHERTGFRLEGRHATTSCAACHPDGFSVPVQSTCGACHQDVHGGALGQRCASCHDEQGWRPLFGADAHRRSNFPLVGVHATLPCEQCHLDAAERAFARPATPCVTCHSRDQQRAAVTSIDHVKARFGNDCQSCHGGYTFGDAAYPEHDKCFFLSAGPHAEFGCRECHTAIVLRNAPGTCQTDTAKCTGCHEHECSKSDNQHRRVGGYQCRDRKCYECHRFTTE